MRGAIVEIGGHQFWAWEGKRIVVDHLPNYQEGDTIQLDRVMLIVEDGQSKHIGTPYVDGAHVKARVLQHLKGPKVIVFKKKRRKRYRVKRGHRQRYTFIEVLAVHSPDKSTSEQ